MTTAAEIWKTLSSIDVGDKVKQKNGLNYLSWAWAWGVLMGEYPDASYEFKDDIVLPDGSVIVTVSVMIENIERVMWLAVMDYRNQAISNPSATHISNTRMRCLTKCLAMFGLGHYIYANEDLPEAVKEENGLKRELFEMFKKAIRDDDCMLMLEAADRMTDEWWKGSYNSFKDNKTIQKKNVDRLLSEGRKMWKGICEDLKQNKADGHEDGMINELLKDIPSEYWQQRLRECNE